MERNGKKKRRKRKPLIILTIDSGRDFLTDFITSIFESDLDLEKKKN